MSKNDWKELKQAVFSVFVLVFAAIGIAWTTGQAWDSFIEASGKRLAEKHEVVCFQSSGRCELYWRAK